MEFIFFTIILSGLLLPFISPSVTDVDRASFNNIDFVLNGLKLFEWRVFQIVEKQTNQKHFVGGRTNDSSIGGDDGNSKRVSFPFGWNYKSFLMRNQNRLKTQKQNKNIAKKINKDHSFV